MGLRIADSGERYGAREVFGRVWNFGNRFGSDVFPVHNAEVHAGSCFVERTKSGIGRARAIGGIYGVSNEEAAGYLGQTDQTARSIRN